MGLHLSRQVRLAPLASSPSTGHQTTDWISGYVAIQELLLTAPDSVSSFRRPGSPLTHIRKGPSAILAPANLCKRRVPYFLVNCKSDSEWPGKGGIRSKRQIIYRFGSFLYLYQRLANKGGAGERATRAHSTEGTNVADGKFLPVSPPGTSLCQKWPCGLHELNIPGEPRPPIADGGRRSSWRELRISCSRVLGESQ